MRKLRILLILHDLSRTGAPRFAVEVMRRLRDIADFWVVSLMRGPLQGDAESLGPVYNLATPPLHSTGDALHVLRHRIARRQWPRRLAEWGPDLIYMNSVASLPILDYFPLPDAPVLLHIHELDTLLHHFGRWRPERLRDLPDRIIAVSEVTRDVLVQSHGVPPEKVAVINAFIDAATFDRLSAMPRESVRAAGDAGRFVVGGAGRLGWRKGIEAWLRSAARLRERLGADKLRYVWVGGEDDLTEGEFRVMARKLGVADTLEIVPMTPDPFPQYQRFDAFAMTSWEDPCPAVVLENMALGNPVVCFAGSGGAQDEVGDTGIVIERFDAAAMGDALYELATDDGLRQRLGDAARRRVTERFTDTALMPFFRAEVEETARLPRKSVIRWK